MMATNLAEGGSISINMEKLSALQILSLDIKKTLEAQIPTIKSTYENIGYTDVKGYLWYVYKNYTKEV